MGTLRRNFRDLREGLINAHNLAAKSIMAFDLKKAMRTLARKTARYYGQTSKHKPHQNDRERARRLRVGSAAWHSAQGFAK